MAWIFLPNFDVVKNFKKAKGLKIYTIGVPDARGHGGDTLVPKKHQENIQKALEKDENGHYLEIDGGTHVTDWWKDEAVYQRVSQIFQENDWISNPFDRASKKEDKKPSSPQKKGFFSSIYQMMPNAKDLFISVI